MAVTVGSDVGSIVSSGTTAAAGYGEWFPVRPNMFQK